MLWKKWFPWRFILRRVARAEGFLDPILVLSRLRRFSQPSEVWTPTELLRSGAVMQARGLMNSQVIQHNPDWVWPYWAERQFDPKDAAFIPRAFNLTHLNLTHRNWTALGIPDVSELPLVDPRGLVTPFLDGWSVDAWVLKEDKTGLVPSQEKEGNQALSFENGLSIRTMTRTKDHALCAMAQVEQTPEAPANRIVFEATTRPKAWLVVSLRPYNPEGVSFINSVRVLPDADGWEIEGKQKVFLSRRPSRYVFSHYASGDVFGKLFEDKSGDHQIECPVGMATAAALYEIGAGESGRVEVRVPLAKTFVPAGDWQENLAGHCELKIPDKKFQFLFDTALRMLVLHSPSGEVYPGPFTYKRFWFRDAAFILHAMLCAGMFARVERALDRFPSRQRVTGYFLSQDGEWDSNGEALWTFERFCRMAGRAPKPSWKIPIRRAGRWIVKKRLSHDGRSLHEGLLPAGFSAEHLGPNDFYYWDDFWGAAGLRSAAYLSRLLKEDRWAAEFEEEFRRMMDAVEKSISCVESRQGHRAVPASPYRRMDAGAIGSLAVSYPLGLWDAADPRVLATAEFLLKECFIDGGFYQEISHSGVNPYLTLHVAQVLLRAGDPRFFKIASGIAELASPTGQWPEAIHPLTKGGCMGDGQHIWAAAEWVILVRNMWVREDRNCLILCSGIPQNWISVEPVTFGPAPTDFGTVSLTVVKKGSKARVEWQVHWHDKPAAIEVRLPGLPAQTVSAGTTHVEIETGEEMALARR